VRRDYARDNDDKCSCRSTDLHARAAEQGDQESRNHGRDQALVRGGAAGDAERHRQGQRDDGDRETGQRVAAP
jgi:hypothetical protein